MADSGCIARLDGPRCGLPPTSGLPICGACLRRMLDEDDPRHRRTLAGCEQLAAGVVQRLAEDPDEQVRARIGAHDDLDAATTSRLANPDREPSAVVWRSIAATRGGAAHAWELLGSDDPATLAILAANPLVDPDILDQLTRYPDPDVAWTASAALTGQPVRPPASDQIATALAGGGLSLDEPSDTDPKTASDPETAAPPADATEELPRPSPPGVERHRHLGLLVGAVGLCVIAAVLVVVAYARGGGDHSSVVADPATTSTTKVPPTTPSTTASTTATTAAATTPPATTTPAPTVPPPPPASVPIATPPPAGPVTQTLTITSASGRFCQQVSVTVSFSPEPASVVVHDDAGFQVGAWSGPSGQSHDLPLASPTSTLQVTVTANGNGLSISGSANGPSC